MGCLCVDDVCVANVRVRNLRHRDFPVMFMCGRCVCEVSGCIIFALVRVQDVCLRYVSVQDFCVLDVSIQGVCVPDV